MESSFSFLTVHTAFVLDDLSLAIRILLANIVTYETETLNKWGINILNLISNGQNTLLLSWLICLSLPSGRSPSHPVTFTTQRFVIIFTSPKWKTITFVVFAFLDSLSFILAQFLLVSGAENRKGATSCSQECIPNIYSFSSEDVVDVTESFLLQLCLNFCPQTSKTLFLPQGRYMYTE